MSGPFTSLGKEVLDSSGVHIADAADTATADVIALALNCLDVMTDHAPTTPSPEGQGA